MGADLASTTGDDGWPFLELVGPGQFPNHQHSVQLVPAGTSRSTTTATPPPGQEESRGGVRHRRCQPTGDQVWDWFDPDYNPPL